MLVAAAPDLPDLHADAETIQRRNITAERLLALYRLHQQAGNSPDQAREFVKHFVRAWKDDSDGPRPLPDDVYVLADRLHDTLIDIWNRHASFAIPPVVIGSMLDSANPFIIRSAGGDALVVMASEMASVMFNFTVGAFAYASELVSVSEIARWIDSSLVGWLTNSPARGPSGNDLITFATVDRRNSEIAMGIAHAAFSWAFYHEVGHLHLGHLPEGTARLHSSPGASGMTVRVDSYSHANELSADLFGLEQLGRLMEHELEIRRSIEFGRGADLAPVMFFEMVDFAYRRFGAAFDWRLSNTHPTPIDRARHLQQAGAALISSDGRFTYDNLWREAFVEMESDLPPP